MQIISDRVWAARVTIHHPDAPVELRSGEAVARFGPGGDFVHEFTPSGPVPENRLPAWVWGIVTLFVVGLWMFATR